MYASFEFIFHYSFGFAIRVCLLDGRHSSKCVTAEQRPKPAGQEGGDGGYA